MKKNKAKIIIVIFLVLALAVTILLLSLSPRKVVAASIDTYSPDVLIEAQSGDFITIGMTFTNTGERSWKFIGGVSVWDEEGLIVGDFEEIMDYSLAPGESVSLQWEYMVVPGYQWIQFGVWKQKPYTKENLLVKFPSPAQLLITGK